MKMLKIKLLLLTLALSVASLSAQSVRECIEKNPNLAGSNMVGYIYRPTTYTDAPKGYKPFYISHYGRHGSRWNTRQRAYDQAMSYFDKAIAEDGLTEHGKEAYRKVKIVCDEANGMAGQLSPKGVAEHRGIAERMVRNFPEVFSTKGGKECRIECLSTLYPRCLLSMAANNERIKEINPEVQFTRATGSRYLHFMASHKHLSMLRGYDDAELLVERRRKMVDAERFIHSIFKPEYAAKVDHHAVMFSVFSMANSVQDTNLDITLYDLFTADELFSLWRHNNIRHYMHMGSSVEYGDLVAADVIDLMRHIITDADDAIANGGRSGFFRFGHDVIIIPLVGMLQLEGRCPRISMNDTEKLHEQWQDFNITSMAVNVQIVFYRNKQGDVLVKVLHNEVEVRLPFESKLAPYYRWEDFRRYYLDRIEKLSKLKAPEHLAKYGDNSVV